MALDELALRPGRRRSPDPPPAPWRRPTPTHRRFLVVQIDGLSRAVLDEALAAGAHALSRPPARASRLPARADGTSGCRRRRRPSTWRRCTGCAPTSLGFTTTIGSSVAISTFRGRDTPRRSRPSRRRGVGASCTAAAPTAASSREAPTITSSASPASTRPKGASVLNALSAFVVAGWVFVKSLTQTIVEVARAGLRFIADRFRRGRPLALAHDQDRHLGVGAPVLHAGGGARSLCGGAGDLRELPRLRRLGARLQSGR